ncbi:MAG: DUF1016 family protein [Bacteroidetes bacterium]|nr:DUF1016 family protein [Bacteroidota bacterium]
MVQKVVLEKQHRKWLVGVKERIRSTQVKAAVALNRELLELYWHLGKEICKEQKRSSWGDGLIERLAGDLGKVFPGVKGFSRANLFYIRKWYLFYQDEKVSQVVRQIGDEKVPELVRQIPWGHNRLIITKCSDVSEALFYVRETIRNNWSRAVLAAQIEGRLYRRKGKAIDNFKMTLPEPQADLAKETLKNPYNFDFLMLGKEAQEKDLETALINHIQKFILELGQGFAYMGRQFPLKVNGDS